MDKLCIPGLLSPTFILQVSVIVVAFIINLVAFYMVLKGMLSDPKNSEKLRGVIVAAVWMAISFIRILIPGMIKAIKQK